MRLRLQGNEPGETVAGSAEGEQRADQKVQGNGTFAGFHFCSPRLAGFDGHGHVRLRHVAPQPLVPQAFRESELDLDVRLLSIAKSLST